MSIQIRKFGSSSQVRLVINTEKAEALKKQFERKVAIRIGVLGSKVERKDGASDKYNNAEIGLVHEKGSKSGSIPRRSFLEVPLTQGLVDKRKSLAKFFDESLKAGDIMVFYVKLGLLSEKVVLKAFSTSGYSGEWSPLKSREGKPLIDTGQLRKSITHEVKG